MRILVIAAYLPWRGHGGGLLVNNLLQELNQRHDVTLLTFDEPGEEQYLPQVAALCRHLRTVPRAAPRVSGASSGSGQTAVRMPPFAGALRRTWRILPSPVRAAAYDIRRLPARARELRQSPWPAEVAARQTPQFIHALRQMVAENDFDVIVAEWPEMVPAAPLLPARAVKVFDSHELRSLTYYRHLRVQRSVDAALFWFAQWRKMRQVEALATREFDIVTAVSHREAQALERYGGTAQIVTNPIGLDLSVWPRGDPVPRWENTLVFLGRMSYTPNQDAVRYFLVEVYPRVRAQVPGVRFVVVGGRPPAEILALDGRDGVSVTGYVPDIKEFLHKGTVFVLPMRRGAGIKVKAMEAMAAGIPIVSTPEGMEGLDMIVDEHDILVARTPAEFAAKTVRLLRDDQLCRRLAGNARRIVWERYNSETNVARLEKLYAEKARLRRDMVPSAWPLLSENR